MILMQLVNKTRGTMLHRNPLWARSFLQMATGLMFRKPRDECLVFIFMPPRREVITMWFVFGSIDVIALDGQGRVLAQRSDLRPWRLWDVKHRASAIIELPAGTIVRSKTRIGDHILLPALKPATIWDWRHYALFVLMQIVMSVLLLLLGFLLIFNR